MAIQSIFNTSQNVNFSKIGTPEKQITNVPQQSFGDMLKEAIHDVNRKQLESDVLTEKLVRGENVELHDVMIAAQKASIALNATMEVRNKVVEAYQEIIRMPV